MFEHNPLQTATDRQQAVAALQALAKAILLDHRLMIAGKIFRLTEVETYLFAEHLDHEDTFTHLDQTQKTTGQWYFHRAKNSFRGGTYKGLDISIGGKLPSPYFGGILLRSAVEEATGHTIEGPCLLVNIILSANQTSSIAEFLTRNYANQTPNVDGSDALSPKSKDALRLVCESSCQLCTHSENPPVAKRPARLVQPCTIYAVPRVGLTLKRAAQYPNHSVFLAAPYRFLTDLRRSKGKPNVLAGLHLHHALAPAEIARITGAKLALVEQLSLKLTQVGAKKGLSNFYGKEMDSDEQLHAWAWSFTEWKAWLSSR